MKVSLMWECDTCDNLRAALYARRNTHAAPRKNANTATWKTLPRYTIRIQRHFIAEKRFTLAVPRRFIPQAGLEKERQARSMLLRRLHIARLRETELERIAIFYENFVKFIILIYVTVNE